ncbi:MAG TPA: pentapeptide repeat-containing protein, partial [Lachnospiraceae bacterium]|nr:pentapeptide repeat-containing protein [Lachnospiraceae bacterium]
ADLRGANLYGADLSDADLSGANLYGANLRRANLYGADLCDANLRRANLRDADLRDADLYGANLRDADLSGANLYDANLYGANLRRANLYGANLRRANLYGADLSGANLCGARNTMFAAFYPLQCPETGAYTAYKKANNLIVQLEIPADARRSSATSRKCRADKAIVMSITNLDGTDAGITSVKSNYTQDFVYTVGETVTVDNFDTDRWRECAPGIHHFITRQEAVDYIC